MPQAIQTNINPAVQKFTNIPSQAGVGGYQYHELGPMGEVIDDPEEFAKLQTEEVDIPESFNDFTERLQSDMGDPFLIDVRADAKRMLKEQERDIFQEWAGGQFRYGGYMPPKAKKAWGEYKQRLLANAEQIVQKEKNAKIKNYEHQVAEWKANRRITAEQRREARGGKTGRVTGGLTESQALDEIDQLDYFVPPELAREAKRIFYDNLKEDTPKGRRDALKAVWDWDDKRKEKGKEPEVEAPPKDYTNTGKLQKHTGKQVWISPNGEDYWVVPD